jgi:predicted nucleic acid-binding Zn ribbon protein
MTSIAPSTAAALLASALRAVPGVKAEVRAVDGEGRQIDAWQADVLVIDIRAAITEDAALRVMNALKAVGVSDVKMSSEPGMVKGVPQRSHLMRIRGTADDAAAEALAGIQFSFEEHELEHAARAVKKMAAENAAAVADAKAKGDAARVNDKVVPPGQRTGRPPGSRRLRECAVCGAVLATYNRTCSPRCAAIARTSTRYERQRRREIMAAERADVPAAEPVLEASDDSAAVRAADVRAGHHAPERQGLASTARYEAQAAEAAPENRAARPERR